MSEKAQVQLDPVPPPKKRGCCGVLKRLWWAIVLVLIAVIVLVVCLVIFVGVPHIAQDKVNQAKLEIQGVSLTQAGSDKFLLGINSTITTDGKIKANIDGFSGVLYLTDAGDKRPFLNVDFPATTAAKLQAVNISQEVNIDDHDSFNRFNIWLFNNKTISITLEGKTKVKPNGLGKKFGVNFKKVVEMDALNKFNGTSVSDGAILLKPVDGANFKAISHINNPSLYTLELGNTTFTSSVDGTTVGQLTIPNLTVRPGNNPHPITATLDQVKILDVTTGPKYCKTGVVPISLLGNGTINHGQELVYYEKALSSAFQVVDMDVASIIKSSLNVTIKCLS